MDFDIGNFLTTLAGAFVGALGAYLFNLKQTKNSKMEDEKAQLTQLFYDLYILTKYLCRYISNVQNLAENICKGTTPYNTPLSIDPETIVIEKLGFITAKSNKMYEILSYTRMELVTIFEQGIIYNEAVIRKKKDSIMQLVAICILAPKLLAMIYVSLFNINSMLLKHYKSENLIKDNVLNGLAEMLELIDNVKKQYMEIENSNDMVCLYTGKPYTQEQKDGNKEDLEYIDYVLNDWVLDFGLSKKEKQKIEKDIRRKLAENQGTNNNCEPSHKILETK